MQNECQDTLVLFSGGLGFLFPTTLCEGLRDLDLLFYNPLFSTCLKIKLKTNRLLFLLCFWVQADCGKCPGTMRLRNIENHRDKFAVCFHCILSVTKFDLLPRAAVPCSLCASCSQTEPEDQQLPMWVCGCMGLESTGLHMGQ